MHLICKKINFLDDISTFCIFGFWFRFLCCYVGILSKQTAAKCKQFLFSKTLDKLVISDKTVSLKCFQKCLILTSNLQGPSWQRVILVPNEWFSMFLKNLG